MRYADDFVILTETKEDALRAKREVAEWLQGRDLTLSAEKTKVCHLTDGFDFLGFNIRHYPVANTKTGYKLLIRPSEESVHSLKRRLKQEWKALAGHNAKVVIKRLTPILRGWANYFRSGVSKDAFLKVDRHTFRRTIRWCKRTYPTKPWKWIK